MPEIAFPWFGYVLIGFLSGTIGALFGVGGAIITTPFLNIIGLPMPFAIGTSAPVIATSINPHLNLPIATCLFFSILRS